MSNPRTMSYSLPFAVSIIMGKRLVAGAARSFSKMEKPSSSGSMMSSNTNEGTFSEIASQNSLGVEKPFASIFCPLSV